MSWDTEKLGNLLTPSGYDRGGSNDYPVLSITMREGLVDQSAKFKKRVASRDTSSYRVAYANELVVGFPIDEGVLGFQTLYPAAIVSPAYSIWKLKNPTDIHIPFVQSYLRSKEARKLYASKMRGAVARRRSINRRDFLDIVIPFPPFDEQRRIAVVLNKVETLRHHREESLQLTEKLLQSVFVKIFGKLDQQPQRKLRDLLNQPLRNGVSPATGGNFQGTVLTLSAITRGLFDSSARKDATFAGFPKPAARVAPSDFLICRGNGNLELCGQGQFPTEDAIGIIFPDTIIAASININLISKTYFSYLWNRPFVRRQIERGARTAAGIFKINQTVLEDILVPVPSAEQQSEFEQIAKTIRKARPDLDLFVESANNFFSSLQQRAFRGELDLSRLKLDEEAETSAVTPESLVIKGRYRRPGSFIATPDVEAQLMALEYKLEKGSDEHIEWSEDYFKYRTLSQVLRPPFSFTDIWNAVEHDIEEPKYETVKDKVFEYVAAGLLEQQFDEERKEIVFQPRA